MPRHLLGRLYLLAGALTLDCVLLASVPRMVPLLGPFAPFGIVTFAMFLCLGHSTLKAQQEDLPFNNRFFVAHLVCIAAVYLGCLAALHGFAFFLSNAALFVFRAVLLSGIALLALACVPLQAGIKAVRVTGLLWLYACVAGVFAWALRYPFQSLWSASIADRGRILQAAAFHSVHAVLRLFLPDITADPATWVIGTPRFAVSIGGPCSGLEGLGLVLVFTSAWLWYFRKENRFPQALLLVPCALGCVWLLNIARICAIVLIGNAGAPDIAMVGFHSQAGWIAFTLVALAFSMAAQKLSWVRKIPAMLPADDQASGATVADARISHEIKEGTESPATAAYLVPFLAILAASFVSKAASGYFEWLYPLRFFAAAFAIWHFWPEYKKLNWRFDWMAPAAGTAIFLVWIVPAWWSHEHAAGPPANALGPALAALSPSARFVWIVFRVAAAVVTVPIAEELAFRGYLSRRLISRDFDTVSFSRLTALSIGLSSVAFGLMHGQHWMAGILAGAAYAAVLKRRGRIGDAIVAHATSNLLLAAWVLLRGDWALW